MQPVRLLSVIYPQCFLRMVTKGLRMVTFCCLHFDVGTLLTTEQWYSPVMRVCVYRNGTPVLVRNSRDRKGMSKLIWIWHSDKLNVHVHCKIAISLIPHAFRTSENSRLDKSPVSCLLTYLSWRRWVSVFGLHVQPDDFHVSPTH